MRASLALAFLLSAVPAALGAATTACPFAGTVAEFLDAVSTDAPAAAAETLTENELERRATGDGFAEGRIDTLRKAFVGLGLGTVDEEDEKLIFHLNPKILETAGDGQLSPRLIVHKATLYEPLVEKLAALAETDPAGHPQRQAALDEQLGDLDDVELHLRWTRQPKTPEQVELWAGEILAESLPPELQSNAEDLAAAADSIGRALAAERASRGIDDGPAVVNTDMAEICAYATTRQLAMDYAAEAVDDLVTFRADLHEALADAHFFRLADLIDGQPLFVAEGSFRRREDVVGPDSRTISLRYDIGGVSYGGFLRWAEDEGRDADPASLPDYLSGFRTNVPKLALSLAYTDRKDFRAPITGTAEFAQAGGEQLSGTLRASGYLGSARTRRLELEATYDDVSDDPARQDRFVGTLSWVEKVGSQLAPIVGGSELVVSLVYGSKPEFRGEVDEELGLRAGLKFSAGEPE